jgi:hypothetical protein
MFQPCRRLGRADSGKYSLPQNSSMSLYDPLYNPNVQQYEGRKEAKKGVQRKELFLDRLD